jgi:putative hydrolase
MLDTDLHVHTLMSKCGMHTVLEVISRARELGMKGLAIADHGPALYNMICGPFFERFVSPVPEVTVYKGMECNLLDTNGRIDLPEWALRHMDIVLLVLHDNTPRGLPPAEYTSMLIEALRRNPAVDIVTHPHDDRYVVEYGELAQAARDEGVALELNVSRINCRRSLPERTVELLQVCASVGCQVAVCTDTHAILELGDDAGAVPFLEETGFPGDLLVTRNHAAARSFIESRRPRKHPAAA